MSELIGIVSRVSRAVPGWDEAIAEGQRGGYRVFDAIGVGTVLGDVPADVAGELVGVVISNEPCSAEVLDRLPSLRAVSCIGTGLDHVDLDAAAGRGIAVTSGLGANAEAVADHTMAMLLSLVRGLGVARETVLAGQGWDAWPPIIPRDFKELTVGIVGLGNIGRAVAARLAGFGSNVVYHDPYVEQPPKDTEDASRTLDELLDEADVVTVHVPLNDDTRGLIGERELRRLKNGAIVLNLSRGGIVDESAAFAALADGHLNGLGLDVFEQEGRGAPAPPDHPRLMVTPHMGGISDRIARETRVAAVKRLIASLQASP
jgi:D-3-phosphoglycerate dehydrogenase / 2-oxoglutarate reductase